MVRHCLFGAVCTHGRFVCALTLSKVRPVCMTHFVTLALLLASTVTASDDVPSLEFKTKEGTCTIVSKPGIGLETDCDFSANGVLISQQIIDNSKALTASQAKIELLEADLTTTKSALAVLAARLTALETSTTADLAALDAKHQSDAQALADLKETSDAGIAGNKIEAQRAHERITYYHSDSPTPSPTPPTPAPTPAPTPCPATERLGSFRDTGHRAFRYGPHNYGYNENSCRNACRDYNYFALQAGGWCCCENDWGHATRYGSTGNCYPNGAGWCNAVYSNPRC